MPCHEIYIETQPDRQHVRCADKQSVNRSRDNVQLELHLKHAQMHDDTGQEGL